jgi:hypothetical protein
MTEETDIRLSSILRRFQARVDDNRQGMLRLDSVERRVAGLRIPDVSQNAKIDRIKSLLHRMERRLEPGR